MHQEVGTQQGTSHSPLLFGRMVAAKFDELCRIWETNGEIPAFRTDHHSLWGIWFIDDAICFFRGGAQYHRLVPQLVNLLASLGLKINIAKSCTLSCCGPPRPLAVLPGLPHVAESKYLGLKLLLTEGDETFTPEFSTEVFLRFLHQPTTAHFWHGPEAFTTANVSLSGHQYNFVVSCCLSPSIHTSSCAAYTTCHPDRLDAPMCTTFLLARCSVYSLCPSCSEALAPLLLQALGPSLVGTTMELVGTYSILHQTLVNLLPTSRDFGHRRVHPGPNNSGHRILLRWLRHQSIDLSLA